VDERALLLFWRVDGAVEFDGLPPFATGKAFALPDVAVSLPAWLSSYEVQCSTVRGEGGLRFNLTCVDGCAHVFGGHNLTVDVLRIVQVTGTKASLPVARRENYQFSVCRNSLRAFAVVRVQVHYRCSFLPLPIHQFADEEVFLKIVPVFAH
jgi:hypothetical protein